MYRPLVFPVRLISLFAVFRPFLVSGTHRRPLRGGFVLSLLFVTSGCVSPPPRVDVAAEERTANDPRAMKHIADAAAASGDLASAGNFYRRAAALAPTDPGPTLSYASNLAAQDHPAEATAVIQDALPHMNDGDAGTLRAALGRLLVVTHRPTEAVAVLRTALARTPGVAPLWITLGVALDASRDFPAAQEAYGKALAIEPGSAAARNDLALSMALGGDTSGALSTLKSLRNRLVEQGGRASDLATVDGNLAVVHALRGELRQAAEAGAGATTNPAQLADNMRFYSALSANGVSDAVPLN